METVTPFKEGIDAIKEAGGEAAKLCYQCGLCNTVCPWNRVTYHDPCYLGRHNNIYDDPRGNPEEDTWLRAG